MSLLTIFSSQQFITISLLAIYTVAIIWIGIRSKHNAGSEDYFLAGRKLPAWILAITFIASWWGGGSAIDLVDHAHRNGISSFWIYGMPVLLSTFLMFLFAKAIRQISTITQPQIMAMRYSSLAAFFLTIFIIIFMVIGAAVQVIVVGNFFHSFFNISYELAAIIGVAIVLAYSFFGGFKGVVLTDVLQFVFFLVTGIFLFVIAYQKSGGFEMVEAVAQANDKDGYMSFFHDVSNNIAYIITFGSAWMIQANVWQRISAAKTPVDARKMMTISFFVFIPLYLMVTLTGMLSSVFYETVPEAGIVPAMILQISSPWISSLLFVGLCSAIMSTMDSLINTGALSLTVDIYQKHISPNSSQRKLVNVGRITTLLIALIALYIGIEIRSVLTISWIGADFLATGVFVPLILGFVWKKGTTIAAISSMVFGLIFSSYNLLIALGAHLPATWEIASVKQALIGMACSFLIFVSISLITKQDKKQVATFMKKTGFLN